MQADYAIELGPHDEVLELPWSARDQGLQYHDLKRHPGLLSQIEEARRCPELGEFLIAVNSSASVLETAKCDAWFSSDIHPEEEIFAATAKFGSYVDLILGPQQQRFSLEDRDTRQKAMGNRIEAGGKRDIAIVIELAQFAGMAF